MLKGITTIKVPLFLTVGIYAGHGHTQRYTNTCTNCDAVIATPDNHVDGHTKGYKIKRPPSHLYKDRIFFNPQVPSHSILISLCGDNN